MFVLLFLLWIIFSGGISFAVVIEGLIVSFLITFFCSKFMGYRLLTPARFLKKAAGITVYILKLLKEILFANIAVLKILYGRKQPEARLVHFKSSVDDERLQTLVANSITLTPGTITVDLNDGEFWVHGLDRSLTEGIKECGFFRDAERLGAFTKGGKSPEDFRAAQDRVRKAR